MRRKVTKTKKKNALLLFLIPVFMILIAGFFSFSVVFDNASAFSYGGAVYVGNNSYYTLNSGSISGYKGEYWGAGIYVDEGGHFNMSGGSIYGNYATGFGDNIYNRGIVYLAGGSVYSDSSSGTGNNIYNSSLGTITIYGGTIGNNQATILNDGTLNVYGGTIKDTIQTTANINTKMSATITGTIQLLYSSAYIIVQDYAGTTPSYTIKPAGVNTKIMTLIGSSTEPDVSKIKIEGYTLTDKLYLKTEKNSSGNWEISLVERVTTITFNPNGGETSTSSKNVAYDATYGDLPTPTKTGYKFLGWSRNYVAVEQNVYDLDSCTRSGTTFTFDTGSKNTSTDSTCFQVQKFLDATYLTDMHSSWGTGLVSFTFTKDSSFNIFRLKLNGNVKDADFRIDLSGLTDGTYVLQMNIQELSMNHAVVSNIMIEQNSENVETTYTNDYVTSTTTNNQLYNHTLFARWQELYCTVYVENLSGTSVEGTVMGTGFGSRSYTKKLGETITISYKSGGVYTFAKVVKGKTFDSTELSDLTYTITSDDVSQGSIHFTVCYTFTVNVYTIYGTVGNDTAGTVSINNGTSAGSVSEVIPFEGPSTNIRVQAIANSSGGYKFIGWCENAAGYKYSYNLSTDYKFSISEWNGDVYLYAKFMNVDAESDRKYVIWGKDWFDYFTPKVLVDKDQIQVLQFRTSSSVTSQQNTYNHRTEITRCIHGYDYTLESQMQNEYNYITIKTCKVGTCVLLYPRNDIEIYADSDMSSCFAEMTNLQKIVFENFNTVDTKNMSEMFAGCTSLESVDLSGFNTYRVFNFDRMFYDCETIDILNLSSFQINVWATAADMFGRTTSIYRLYTPKHCTANVALPTEMFDYVDTTLQDTDYAGEADAEYGPYTYLPNGERGSRYYTKTIPSSRSYKEFTSDIISALTTTYELPAGSELRIKFDFNEPDLFFGWQSISAIGGQVCLKDVGNVYEFIIICDDFLKFNEKKLFYTVNKGIKSKIKLTSIEFINVCTDSNTNMESMFQDCANLETVEGLQNFHFIEVTTMDFMFMGCSNLQYINMANAKTFNNYGATIAGMVDECTSLGILDMENMIVSDGLLFNGCDRIQVFVSPAEGDITIGETNASFVDRNGKTVTRIRATGTSVTIYVPGNLGVTTAVDNRSSKSEKLELSKFFNNFSVYAMVCISAIAYPVYEEQRRKIKKR